MAVEERESPGRRRPGAPIARAVAVINPVSGAGLDRATAAMRATLLRDAFARAGIPIDIHLTERAGHARELATTAVAGGADTVIVWGGDGTINEAAAALVGTRTALGLVPAGSGNGFAAALGVPRTPAAAVQHALERAPRTIDVGLLDGRAFFNIAGVGIDACIAGRFNERPRGRRGRWPYIMIGLREGCRYKAREYDLELDGRRRRVAALLIAFANGQEYGMGACLSPDAKLDDGLLEATVVEDRPVLARFMDARHLAMRSVMRAPRVHVSQIREARITTDGVLHYHVDGEPGSAQGTIDVSLIRDGLRVRA